MEDKKLGYSVHVHGELEKAISCPMGVYYVDIKNHFYHFEAKEGLDRKHALVLAMGIAVMAANEGIKNGHIVKAIHESFESLPEEHLKKEGDKYLYDFYIQGDMHAYVTENTLGILYGDEKNEVYYFEAKHKGFMTPILRKKFFEGIAKDLKSEDSEKRAAAVAVGTICKEWTELDEEDIVR
jgi:hypothetical protein